MVDSSRGGQIEYKNSGSTMHLEYSYLPVLREWFSHEQTIGQHDFMSTYMFFKTKKYRPLMTMMVLILQLHFLIASLLSGQ